VVKVVKRTRSTQRIGVLALAVLCLVGMGAPVGAGIATSRAAMAAAPDAVYRASERPREAVAYAQPAVVRVLTYYYGTTQNSGPVPVPVACAGTGALVGTIGADSFNYVLTAMSLINPLKPCEGAQAAFQQLDGKAQSWGLARIEIWLAAAYSGTSAKQLGTIVYGADPAQVTSNGGPLAPKLVALALSPVRGAPSHDLPVLQPPQPSDLPVGPTQTVLDLGSADAQLLGRDALSTSEVPGTLFPAAFDGGQLPPEAQPAATKSASPTAPTGTATPSALAAGVSVGAPIINDNGALVGMVIADASGAKVAASPVEVVQAIGAVSSKPGPLMAQWKQGMTAYYANPPDFAGATTAFSSLASAAPDFGGVTPYLMAAKQHSTLLPSPGGTPAATEPTPAPTVGLLDRLGTTGLVAIVGLALFALLLATVFILLRALRRRGVRIPAERLGPPALAPAQPRLTMAGGSAPRAADPLPAPSFASTESVPRPPVTAQRGHSGGPWGMAPEAAGGVEDVPTVTMPVAPAVSTTRNGRGANLIFQVAGLTDPGRKRSSDPNQDNILALTGMHPINGRPQTYGLFIVADGMGGHMNGKEASRRTIEVMTRHILPTLTGGQPLDAGVLSKLLKEAAMKAHADLNEQNLARHADMGTTLTAALVVGDVAHVANVGDSRTYLLSPDSGLRRITSDHSVVASLVAAGVIQPDDVYTHPRRNQIYRSLGGQHEDTEVDTFEVAVQPGDRLLLCSDGLWEMVRDPQIESILRATADPRQATELLVREANNQGGEDNISVIVVRMLDEQPLENVKPGMQLIVGPQGSE
jgi:serine/threonine protein phosphatase PrpC